MSARGLAIDTAVNEEEEFSRFSAFWLEKPLKPEQEYLFSYRLHWGAGESARACDRAGNAHRAGGRCRAMFDLVPGDSEEPINIRLYLRLGDEPFTET